MEWLRQNVMAMAALVIAVLSSQLHTSLAFATIAHNGSSSCTQNVCKSLEDAVSRGFQNIVFRSSAKPYTISQSVDVADVSLNCSDASIVEKIGSLRDAQFSDDAVLTEKANLEIPRALKDLESQGRLCIVQQAAPSPGQIDSVRLFATGTPLSKISFMAENIVFFGFVGQSPISSQGSLSAQISQTGSVLSVSGPASVTLSSCVFTGNRAAPWTQQLNAERPDQALHASFEKRRDLSFGAVKVKERWGQATGSAVSVFHADSAVQKELLPFLRYQKRDAMLPLQHDPSVCGELNTLASVADVLGDTDLFGTSAVRASPVHGPCREYGSDTAPCSLLVQFAEQQLNSSNLWEPISRQCAKYVNMPSASTSDKAHVDISNTIFWGNAGQSAALLLYGVSGVIHASGFLFNEGALYERSGPYAGGAVSVGGNSSISLTSSRIAYNHASHAAGLLCTDSNLTLSDISCNSNSADVSSACLSLGNFVSRTSDKGSLPPPLIERRCQASIDTIELTGNTVQRGAVGALGVFGKSVATVQNASFINNFASVSAGVFVATHSTFLCKRCKFLNNTITEPFDAGGAALSVVDGSHVEVEDSLFAFNTASNSGGAVGIYAASLALDTRRGFAFPSSATFLRVEFRSNRAVAGSGGAIQVSRGHVTISSCDFQANFANLEGAGINVATSSDLELWDFDSRMGGKYYSAQDFMVNTQKQLHSKFPYAPFESVTARVVINGSTFRQNVAVIGGGAALSCGRRLFEVIVDACQFSENVAQFADAGAVKISKFGRLILTNSTFVLNSAQRGRGGAVHVTQDALMTASGALFIENSASGISGGGAIAVSFGAEIQLRRSTISRNKPTQFGGAVWVEASAAFLIDSVIEEATATPGLSGIGGGLLVSANSIVEILRCRLRHNTAAQGGCVAVIGGSSLKLSESNLLGCSAVESGGAFFIDGSSALISAVSSVASFANSAGGGFLYAIDDQGVGSVQLNDATITDTNAFFGGAFACSGGSLKVTNVSISASLSETDGGAFSVQAGCNCGMANLSTTNSLAKTGQGGMFHVAGTSSLVLVQDELDVLLSSASEGGAASVSRGGGLRFQNSNAAFTNCSSTFGSGGVLVLRDSEVSVFASHVSMLFSQSSVSGAAVFSEQTSIHVVQSVWIADVGTSPQKGGLFHFGGNAGAISCASVGSGSLISAMYVDHASTVDLRAGKVEATSSLALGGGMFIGKSSCVFVDGTLRVHSCSAVAGGGIAVDNGGALSSGPFAMIALTDNYASHSGGGMFCSGCLLELHGAHLVANRVGSNAIAAVTEGGGGLATIGHATVRMQQARFIENVVFGGHGAGMLADSASVMLSNTLLQGNCAKGSGAQGGGAYIINAQVHVESTKWTANHAEKGADLSVHSQGSVSFAGESHVRPTADLQSACRMAPSVLVESSNMTLEQHSTVSVHGLQCTVDYAPFRAQGGDCEALAGSMPTPAGLSTGSAIILRGQGALLNLLSNSTLMSYNHTAMGGKGVGLLVEEGAEVSIASLAQMQLRGNMGAAGVGLTVQQGAKFTIDQGPNSHALIVSNNHAAVCAGGALFASRSTSTIRHALVQMNSAQGEAAGILISGEANVNFEDSYISENLGTCTHGGVVCRSSEDAGPNSVVSIPRHQAQVFGNLAELEYGRDIACPLSSEGIGCKIVDAFSPSGVVSCNEPRTLYVQPESLANPNCCGSRYAPCPNLQAAIMRARNNDVILLSAGLYRVLPGGVVHLNHNIRISSDGSGPVVFECLPGGGEPVFVVKNAQVVLEGLHVRNCFSRPRSTASLSSAAISCSDDSFQSVASTARLEMIGMVLEHSSVIEANQVGTRALISTKCEVRISLTRFQGIVGSLEVDSGSELMGAAVLIEEARQTQLNNVSLINCGFFNTSGSGAIAIVASPQSTLAQHVRISALTGSRCSAARGGCLFVRGSPASSSLMHVIASGMHFFSNEAMNAGRVSFALEGGGDIFGEYTNFTIQSMSSVGAFTTSTIANGGSLLFANSHASITSSALRSCSAAGGGCIQASSGASVSLLNTSITQARAHTSDGGGLQCTSCEQVSVLGSTFSGCSAERYGGGVRATNLQTGHRFQLAESKVSHCAARSGGGISISQAAVLIRNSRVYNCSAKWRGGGLHATKAIDSHLQNSTFLACQAGIGGGGVAVQHDTDSASVVGLTISQTQFVRNSACLAAGGLLSANDCQGQGGGLLVNRIRDNPAPVASGNSNFSLVRTMQKVSLLVTVCDGSQFHNNVARSGGGVYSEHHGVRVVIRPVCDITDAEQGSYNSVVFSRNTAHYAGGGVSVRLFAELLVQSGLFDGNTALRGGAAAMSGALLHISSSEFTNNRLNSHLLSSETPLSTLDDAFELGGAAVHIHLLPAESEKRVQTIQWQQILGASYMSELSLAFRLETSTFVGHMQAALVTSIRSPHCDGLGGAAACTKLHMQMVHDIRCSVVAHALDFSSSALMAADAASDHFQWAGYRVLPREVALVAKNRFAAGASAAQSQFVWAGWGPVGLAQNAFCQSLSTCSFMLKPTVSAAAALQSRKSCDLVKADSYDSGVEAFLDHYSGMSTVPVTALVAASHTSTDSVQPLQLLDSVHLVALDAFGAPASLPSEFSSKIFLQVKLVRQSSLLDEAAPTLHTLGAHSRQSSLVQQALSAWEAGHLITDGSEIYPTAPSIASANESLDSVWALRLDGETASGLSGQVFTLSVPPTTSPAANEILGSPSTKHSIVIEFCNPGFAPSGSAGLCQSCAAGWVSPNGSVCTQCPAGTIARKSVECVFCEEPFYSIAGSVQCESCAEEHYVAGRGSPTCSQCPVDNFGQGSECQGGEIRLSNGYFFVESDAYPTLTRSGVSIVSVESAPLPADTAVISCFNPEACVTTPNRRAMQCAKGYSGVLCGDCTDGYLSAGGGVCLPCLADGVNYSVLVLVTLGVLAAVVYVSLSQTFEEKDDFNIALRLLLNHLQMMGLLSLLRAQGTTLFRSIFNFSGVVSGGGIASPVTSVRCIWNSNFFVDFALNISTPPLLMITSVLTGTFAAAYTAMSRAADDKRFLNNFLTANSSEKRQVVLSLARRQLVARRRASSTVAGKNPISGGAAAAPTAAIPSGQQTKTPAKGEQVFEKTSADEKSGAAPKFTMLQRAQRSCLRCTHVCCGQGCNLRLAKAALLAMKDYIGSGAYFSTLAFIASMTFSMVTTSVLNAFRCTDFEAYGSRWLIADMSLPCFDSTHIAVLVVAATFGFLFCVGFPLAVIYILQQNKSALAFDPQFRARYAFLIAGYTNEQAQTEGYGMLRRLAIALISVISSPIHEINAAAVIILAAISLHVSTHPFKRKIFNLVETVSLWTVELTLMISMVFLEVTRSSASSGVVASAATNFETVNLVITILLCVVNFATLAMMLFVLLRFGSHFMSDKLAELAAQHPWLARCLPSPDSDPEKAASPRKTASMRVLNVRNAAHAALRRVASGLTSSRRTLLTSSRRTLLQEQVPTPPAVLPSQAAPSGTSILDGAKKLSSQPHSRLEAHNPLHARQGHHVATSPRADPARTAASADGAKSAARATMAVLEVASSETRQASGAKSRRPLNATLLTSPPTERASFKSEAPRTKRSESQNRMDREKVPEADGTINPLARNKKSAAQSRTARLSLLPGMQVLAQHQATNLQNARRRRASLLRKSSAQK